MSQYRCPLGALVPSKPDPEQIKREGWREQSILVVSADDHRLDFFQREFVKQIGEKNCMGQSATAEVFAPLFRSAHAALIFALNYSDQIYERPLMNRLAAPAPGSGKGLVGVDGAGQAGMIRAELKALWGLHENILVARLAPRQRYCECRGACCSGRKPNPEWVGAVSWLSEHVRVTALAGCLVDYRVRRNCVEIFFGKSLAVAALADDCGIARNTASAHLSRVRKRLKEDEHHAQVAIDDRLRQAGILI